MFGWVKQNKSYKAQNAAPNNPEESVIFGQSEANHCVNRSQELSAIEVLTRTQEFAIIVCVALAGAGLITYPVETSFLGV